MKKQTAEMTSATKEPNPIEKHSPNLDDVRYDAHRVKGLLQMFDEAMEKEWEWLGKLVPNNTPIILARQRYEHVISTALDSARIVIEEIINELGEG